MKRRRKFGIGLLIVGSLVYLNNASWIAGAPDGEMSLLAHRGVHQTYHRKNLNNDTCTAERIDEPSHEFLENTLPSMRAAIEAGADIIEFDIHLTTDGEFVVFHDWTIDCRTEGSGETRDHDLAYLKSLDIGYGYTADGGETYPFRGKFVGAMPILEDVLSEFPQTIFLINIKSRSKSVANAFLEYMPEEDWQRISLMGHSDTMRIIKAVRPDTRSATRQGTKSCLQTYLLIGWSGHVPKSCHNMEVQVPANLRRLAWGWPHRFEKRLNSVGSRSVLRGDLGSHLAGGIDTDRDIARVPADYTGIVYTNKIEKVGPVLKKRARSSE